MSTKDTFDKAYGHVPREVNVSDIWGWIPTGRTFKYYYLRLIRSLTR